MRITRGLIALSILGSIFVAGPARAASAPDRGTAFNVKVRSKALYRTQPPSVDPETQQHFVEGHDGTALYVETWVPLKKKGGPPVPKRLPTILIMTP